MIKLGTGLRENDTESVLAILKKKLNKSGLLWYHWRRLKKVIDQEVS